MKILVTGGAGFVGSNLVESLSQHHDVIVIDNFNTGNMSNLKSVSDKITFIGSSVINLLDYDIQNIDYIYHLGMPSSSPMYKENPFLFGEVVNGAISVFEYAKIYNVKKVIYASSSSLYSGLQPPHKEDMNINVTDYYTEARLGVERIAKLYNILHGVKSIGLRFFSVYGPHEEFKKQYANIITQFLWEMKKGNSPVIYGNGEQRRDFVFVKDVVKVCNIALHSDTSCDIFNVGTGAAYSFNQVVELLNTKLEKDIEPTYIDMPSTNYVDCTQADMKKSNKFGFFPTYTLKKGIDELVQVYGSN